jgi:basic membrane protein A
MRVKSRSRLVAIAMAGALILAACGGGGDGETATGNQPVTGEAPTELNVAAIFLSPVEEPWNTSWLQAWDRVKAVQPHGLSIDVQYTENVAPPDAERVLREFASAGTYEIIWAHSSFSDAVKVLKDEFPEILWAVSGSGNEGLGGNVYWADVFVHEPAYLMGIIAGKMTQTNVIGAVAAFPFPNVNLPLNAYIAGAQSVNAEVEVKAAYIESWFDPQKAKETAEAQLSAGADFIYAERFGPFEAVQAKPETFAFGHFVDQNSLAPEVVVTSALALWDPSINVVIDAWFDHVTKGTPYSAPTDRVVFLMKDGGADIAPYHDVESLISQDVKDAVAQAREEIVAGTLEVPANEEPVTSG